MVYGLQAFDKLISVLQGFPGVGQKTAERMALYLMRQSIDHVEKLTRVIREARERIRYCSRCYLFAEQDLCKICSDSQRDSKYLCVIEQPNQAFALERLGVYKGRYHVLMGKISPLEGIGPEDLHIVQLQERIIQEKIEEVIIATGMDVEGEATSIYIANLLNSLPVKVTRIAYGIPVGMGIDYADAQTLSRAIQGRQIIVSS